jgi:DNA invertase Pin-like site-specific DNA recombinase
LVVALIGYGRVSTRDQNPDSQRDQLAAAGVEDLFIDKASGKLASRPQLDAALRHLRDGDVLVVTKLDRLGRSVKHLAEVASVLEDRGVQLRVLQQGIDTTTSVGRLFFHILAAIAEFEHELIKERTVDGLAAARARGRNGGRKSSLTPAARRQIQEMYDSRDYTVEQIAKAFKTTRPTIYRTLDPATIGKTGRDDSPRRDANSA